MDFSHYPRIENDAVVAIVWPRPPDHPNFKSLPRLAPRNPIHQPLGPGQALVTYHSAGNFTRFTGSIAADQPLLVRIDFSNDEVAPDGHYVSDHNLSTLNWDTVSLEKKYSPQERHPGVWCIKMGKWLRLTIDHQGTAPVTFLRVYLRGSTF